jgi:hypothetical protein
VTVLMDCDCTKPEDNLHDLSPGFSCPSSGCGTNESTETDNCSNSLKIQCSTPNCWYRYLFNSTLIGHCPYGGGVNWYRYKKTINDDRFHSTWHRSRDPSNSGTNPPDEGTLNKYDWVVWKYDCLNTPASPTAYCREHATSWGDEDFGDPSNCETLE